MSDAGGGRIVPALVLGAIGAIAVILASSGGDLDRASFGDGQIHRYLATHLTTPPDQIDPAVAASGTSLRFGRIGFPLVLWAASGGTDAGVRVAQPLLMIITGAATAAAIVTLLPRAPVPWALLAMAAPGFALSLAGGFADGIALTLALWAIVAARTHPLVAAALLAYATLTKETAGAVLIALVIWRLRSDRRGAGLIALGALPPIAWHLFVRARFGHLPLLDPYLTGPRGLDLPGAGLVRSLTDPWSGTALAVTIIHVGVAAALIVLARRSLFALAGSFASVALLPTSPDGHWRYVGDAMRTSQFLEVFLLLTLLVLMRPAYARTDVIREVRTLPPGRRREPEPRAGRS